MSDVDIIKDIIKKSDYPNKNYLLSVLDDLEDKAWKYDSMCD